MKLDVSKLISERWPSLEWNPHMVRMADAAYEHRLLGITGGPCTSKTTFLAAYALSVFEHSPADTHVVWFCSSLQEAHLRGFGIMARLYEQSPRDSAFSFSRCMVHPCGEVTSGAGIHFIPSNQTFDIDAWNKSAHGCRNLLAVVDDSSMISPSLGRLITLQNLEHDNFQAIVAGNPCSRRDLHGKFCQPRHGWESIGLTDKEWPTIMGHCVHLDSLPIVEGYSGLMTQEKLDMFRNLHGEDAPEYYRFVRGFWAPAQEAPKSQP